MRSSFINKLKMETVMDIDECPICMDHGNHPIKELPCCRHKICEKCYSQLPRSECPYCRHCLVHNSSNKQEVPNPLPSRRIIHYDPFAYMGCCMCIVILFIIIVCVVIGWKM